MKHMWRGTESQWQGQDVQRCAYCGTERTRDTSTKSLFLYRRGRTTHTNNGPMRKPMSDEWTAFKAGIYPACPDLVLGSKP